MVARAGRVATAANTKLETEQPVERHEGAPFGVGDPHRLPTAPTLFVARGEAVFSGCNRATMLAAHGPPPDHVTGLPVGSCKLRATAQAQSTGLEKNPQGHSLTRL